MKSLLSEAKQQLLRRMAETTFTDNFHIKATWNKYEKYQGVIVQKIEVPVKLGYSLYQMYFFQGTQINDFIFNHEVVISCIKGSFLMEGKIFHANELIQIPANQYNFLSVSTDTHLQIKFTPELDILSI